MENRIVSLLNKLCSSFDGIDRSLSAFLNRESQTSAANVDKQRK